LLNGLFRFGHIFDLHWYIQLFCGFTECATVTPHYEINSVMPLAIAALTAKPTVVIWLDPESILAAAKWTRTGIFTAIGTGNTPHSWNQVKDFDPIFR
jgi:hypothetical protein